MRLSKELVCAQLNRVVTPMLRRSKNKDPNGHQEDGEGRGSFEGTSSKAVADPYLADLFEQIEERQDNIAAPWQRAVSRTLRPLIDIPLGVGADTNCFTIDHVRQTGPSDWRKNFSTCVQFCTSFVPLIDDSSTQCADGCALR